MTWIHLMDEFSPNFHNNRTNFRLQARNDWIFKALPNCISASSNNRKLGIKRDARILNHPHIYTNLIIQPSNDNKCIGSLSSPPQIYPKYFCDTIPIEWPWWHRGTLLYIVLHTRGFLPPLENGRPTFAKSHYIPLL